MLYYNIYMYMYMYIYFICIDRWMAAAAVAWVARLRGERLRSRETRGCLASEARGFGLERRGFGLERRGTSLPSRSQELSLPRCPSRPRCQSRPLLLLCNLSLPPNLPTSPYIHLYTTFTPACQYIHTHIHTYIPALLIFPYLPAWQRRRSRAY